MINTKSNLHQQKKRTRILYLLKSLKELFTVDLHSQNNDKLGIASLHHYNLFQKMLNKKNTFKKIKDA
ncbi:hypothetical protein BpHYR1_043817 [Brachionus plicatilis]|uniref:Uncharacterized protein n=1 Tax=Brachionus plicatilis TaxID=10195 RepID=A0A3M7RWC6_BRAPC|nr:hypothetical protein BpHYR1_043817 [Brachionus plicatilis]